jgi:ABC-type branched-subunit amino acid transport system substrate-binding protein
MAPPSNPAFGNIFDGTTVAADAINANGGVDGHPVRVIDCNSGAPLSDPNDTAKCANEAAQNHVLALVGNVTFFTSNLYTSLQPGSIANIAALPATPIDNTNPLSYPVQPDNDTTYAGIGLMLGRQRCKTVAFVGLQGEGSVTEYAKAAGSGARFAGAKAATPVLLPTNQADFAPTVGLLTADHVDCVAFGLQPTQLGAFLTAIKDSGAKLKVGVNVTSVPDLFLKAIGTLANGVFVEDILTPASAHTAGQQRLDAQFHRYLPKSTPNPIMYPGWEGVNIFAQAATTVLKGSKSVTAKSVVAALNKMSAVDYGIGPPANFSNPGPVRGKPRISNASVYFERIVNGTVTPLSLTAVNVAPALIKYPA